ncbi:MAG: DUF87 domain-containing protein [Candidatus Sedimenticola sp. (ex Thyasira tokunagai)]
MLQYTHNSLLGITADDVPESMLVGEYSLMSNPSFAAFLLEKYAIEKGYIPTFEQYLNLFKPLPELELPQLDDPDFATRTHGVESREQQIKRYYFHSKFLKKHEARAREHQALQERSCAIAQDFDPDFRGYLSFLNTPAFQNGASFLPKSFREADRFFFNRPHELRLREADREQHTYVTARSGHGKSVTLETIVNHYLVKNTETAMVLIDPHGDFARDCAQLLPNLTNDRLIYVKPSLDRGLTPVLNPFQTHCHHWDEVNKAVDDLIEVFQDIMRSSSDSASFSPQMVTLLKPCLSALLQLKGASFIDLVRFLDDDPAEYQTYLNFARRTLTNPMHLDALEKDFMKESYNPSKLSIKTKIRNLLNDGHFFNFLVGENTFDLEEAINRKAFIVFDLGGISKMSKRAIGRFVMANLTTIAFAREKIPYQQRVPVHLFVDECQHFISDSLREILTETRKFRLFGTFAQQFTGQGMDTETKKAIIGNSFIKITGNNGHADLKLMSVETGIPKEELETLKRGEFHIKAGTSPSIRTKVPMIKKQGRQTKQQWSSLLSAQTKRYYRPIQHMKAPQDRGLPDNPDVVKDSSEASVSPRSGHASSVEEITANRGKNLRNPFDQ